MADTKTEREYVIPLRRAFLKVPRYERTGRAIKEIKKFIARHMKVPDRDTKKVKIDVYFNNEIWFRGRKKPPSKVKVRAKKEGDIVKVNFAESPKGVGFLKLRQSKFHKKAEKPKKEKKAEEEKKEEKTAEEKKEEQEKKEAVTEQRVKQAEQEAKAQKHVKKGKEQIIRRQALKK